MPIISATTAQWVTGLSQKLAPSTVEVLYGYAATIFRAAVADGKLALSPCRGINLPEVEIKQVIPLRAHAVEALVDAMPERYQALVAVAAGTGMRQGEVFGLTVPHVDFLRRDIRVAQQLTVVTGSPRVSPPKTKASYRTNPAAPSVVIDALATHLARRPPDEQGFIFTDEHERPIRRNRFNEIWKAAVGRAGLPAATHFHELRHFYASLLIHHGSSVKVVHARLGHKTAIETLDTYGHLWPDSEDHTRSAVDAVLRRLADPARTIATP